MPVQCYQRSLAALPFGSRQRREVSYNSYALFFKDPAVQRGGIQLRTQYGILLIVAVLETDNSLVRSRKLCSLTS